MTKCDHQFKTSIHTVTKSLKPIKARVLAQRFLCPFCGQIRDVDTKTGEITIIVKGRENPIP